MYSAKVLALKQASVTEFDIERRFAAYAKAKGCHALKLRIDGIDGFPDRTVLAPDGRVYFAEFKRPGGTLRPAQRTWSGILSRLGFIV